MNLTRVLELVRELYQSGKWKNAADDFLFDHRFDADHGAALGSALLLVKRVAKGEAEITDEALRAGEQFLLWYERDPSQIPARR